MSWAVASVVGSATELHGRELPAERTVWIFQPSEPAVVLGSTQPASVVRPGADIEVVRRRSGGGAVLLVPGEVLWVDVVVPRHDVLWDDDVGRATHWLGELWVRALAGCGVVGASVHTGAMVCRPWSKLVCFAGLGPGEVLDRRAQGRRDQPAAHEGGREVPVRALPPLGSGRAGGSAGRPPPLRRGAGGIGGRDRRAPRRRAGRPARRARPRLTCAPAAGDPRRRPDEPTHARPTGAHPRALRQALRCAASRRRGPVECARGAGAAGPVVRAVGGGKLGAKWGEVVDSGGSWGLRWGHVGRRGEAAQAPPIGVDPTEAGRTTDSR